MIVLDLRAETHDPRWPWLQFGGLRKFHWSKQNLPIYELPQALTGLRMLHLTDTHIKSRWCAAHGELLERIQADPPDLILFTGDFVDAKIDPRVAFANLERFIKGLRSRLGVFAITGNHDGDLFAARADAWGVHLINERLATIRKDHADIELIGLPGMRRRNFDPNWMDSLPAKRRDVPRIVLAHFPDQIRHIQPLQADLMLAGHTHGGQICLPNGRAMLTHDQLPKVMARGTWQVGHTRLIVSRGLGWTKWPIRVFCPAEVVEIRIECKTPNLGGA